MDSILLVFHSFFRWLLLAALLYTIISSVKGWKSNRKFSSSDNRNRTLTASLAHLQLVIGLLVYFGGNTFSLLAHNFKEAMKDSNVRFFAMEHSLIMLIAIAVITIGSVKAKGKTADTEKFKTLAIWFGIGLLLILLAIPWPFSPFAARPWFRGF
jgi:hypothetical protein